MDPQHNSFVYANERILEKDKHKNPLGHRFISKTIKKPAFVVFAIFAILSLYVGITMPPKHAIQKVSIDLQTNTQGQSFYMYKGKPIIIDTITPIENAKLTRANVDLAKKNNTDLPSSEFVSETKQINGQSKTLIYQLKLSKHWGIWSLLPAIVAIALCWLTREPVTSLFSGILIGALLLQQYDLVDTVLLQSMATKSAAGIMLLYLWLLGGLMGIWARTGAAKAFADLMTKHIVKGPRSAKFVAWVLGVIFFQGEQ